jgi:hypothetical protein
LAKSMAICKLVAIAHLCPPIYSHILPFLALFNMGYGQNWPSANSYSQIR